MTSRLRRALCLLRLAGQGGQVREGIRVFGVDLQHLFEQPPHDPSRYEQPPDHQSPDHAQRGRCRHHRPSVS